MADNNPNALLEMTTGIIANFVANNRVTPEELPGLVATVHDSLSRLGSGFEPNEDVAPERLTPGAIRKLITPDGIRSLIDGRVFKSMKRHLTLNGLSPQEYRAKYGLPTDFPMVHPDYSQARSALAKAAGLGSGGRQAKKTPATRSPRKPRTMKA